jgi:hypothetical protein
MCPVQAPVKLERGADQREMGQRLPEVAQRFAADRDLFGAEANMICVSRQLLEHAPSVVHPARSHRRLCVPLLGIHPQRGETFGGIGDLVLRRDDLQFVAAGLEGGPDHRIHCRQRVLQRIPH